MNKLKGKSWSIDTDTNTININNKLTTEQLARIVDSAANYERDLFINTERESIEWTIKLSEFMIDLTDSKMPEAIIKGIENERYKGPGVPPMKKNKK